MSPTSGEHEFRYWFASSGRRLSLADFFVHLGVDRDFRPAQKAHPGLLVSGLEVMIERLRAAGHALVEDEPLAGYHRVFVNDPFGNRLELMEPRP